MRRNRTDSAPSKAVRFLTVLAVLMTIVMLIVLGRMTSELHRVFARDPYTSIDYNLQQGNYDDMVSEYYRRAFDVAPFSSIHEEEYHVAQYADAAFRHQYFETVGDSEMAGRLAEEMARARQESGSLSSATEDIDRLLAAIPRFS